MGDNGAGRRLAGLARTRGEPDAVRVARRVRRAGQGNGPAERPKPRPGPTLLVHARRAGLGVVAGQRPACEEPAGPQDRCLHAAWLAQLLECGRLRCSFIPTPVMARMRDLTRYRTKLVQERARETQRVQKTLKDAGIKLDSVVTDVMGKAARRMIEALIAGERNPRVLAEMALTRMRPKIPELRLALEGRFGDHHALMLRMHLDHIDHLTAAIASIEAQVEAEAAPFAPQVERLLSIPGIGLTVAWIVIAEIGIDMSRFPSAAHLASWVGVCPGNHESAGKRARAEPARATPHYEQPCARSPGPRCVCETAIWPPSTSEGRVEGHQTPAAIGLGY
jgi:transposase